MVVVGLATGAISTAPVAMSIQVNGVEYADHRMNPAAASVDISSIRISQDIRGNATCSFDIIDKLGTLGTLPMWCDVAIWDGYVSLLTNIGPFNAAGPDAMPWPNGYLFKGMLVDQQQKPAYGIGQIITVDCVDFGLLLDRTFIPAWSNVASNGAGGFFAGGPVQLPALLSALQAYGLPADVNINSDFMVYAGEVVGALNAPQGDTPRGLIDMFLNAALVTVPSGSRDYFVWVTPQGYLFCAPPGFLSTVGRVLFQTVGPVNVYGGYVSRSLITDSVTGGPDSNAQLIWDTPGLVGYWRLDETHGAVAYSRMGMTWQQVQNGNSPPVYQLLDNGLDAGTFTGGPSLAQKIGLSVTGEATSGVVALVAASSQYVTVPSSPRIALGDTITFECWVARSTATAQGIMNLGAGSLQVVWNADGSVSGQKAGTGDFMKSTTTIPSDSSFHHVVVVKTPGAAAIYIDGVSVGGAYTPQTLSVSSSALEMGRQQGGTNYLNGWLGRCALYATAIAAQDAIAHYRARAIVIGTTKGEDLVLETDGTQGESAVWDPTSGRFIYIDAAAGLDRGVQSAYRQLATTALPPGVSAKAYLGPKATRIRGQVVVTGREAFRLGEPIGLTNSAEDQVATALLIYGIDTAFISGTGLRKNTLRFGSATAIGSKPSAARQLGARLAKSGI